jgi:carotenoid cleavage dioxygenase
LAGAWECSGKIYIETPRVFANLFPLWGGKDALPFSMIPEADFVCWELDLSKPTQNTIPDPEVVVDVASDFPLIDERRMGRHYNIIYLPVVVPDLRPNGFPMPVSLNALSKVDKKAKTIE